MFRLSTYVRALVDRNPLPASRAGSAPVIIWNLIRRCNLDCSHCYSSSSNKDFAGELSFAQVCTVMDDLWRFGVRFLILSGGEPLLRADIFDIAARAKSLGFYVGLSSNGTLIDDSNIDKICQCQFDYVGISLDGNEHIHDRVRGKPGSYKASLNALRTCRDRGFKVGVRFTLTQQNAADLPDMLSLLDREQINRFYFSHLNYAGRGAKNRLQDAHHVMTRQAVELIFEACLERTRRGHQIEFTSGNNDADGVFFLLWARQHFPDRAAEIETHLRQWGGNSSGIKIANIDNRGNVHPDTMWWHVSLGNVKSTPFSQIWSNDSLPLLSSLRQAPRAVKGRCASCLHQTICNGNSRIRAYQHARDLWAEDPGCYLTDAEIGLQPAVPHKLANPSDAKVVGIPGPIFLRKEETS